MAILKTTLPEGDDGPSRQAFKALLPCEKDEKKKVIFFSHFLFCLMQFLLLSLHYCALSFVWFEFLQFVEYVEKISLARNCSFLSAAKDIFSAKISGTFKRFVVIFSNFFQQVDSLLGNVEYKISLQVLPPFSFVISRFFFKLNNL